VDQVLPFTSARAFFSPDTPAPLHRLLDVALSAKSEAVQEQSLLRARTLWPDEPDTHIALYKYYFVCGKYNLAETAVWQALKIAAALIGCNRNYRKLDKCSADWARKSGPERLYLFSLKALGVCRLRRGRVLAAASVLRKLRELDESDDIGGAAYLEIAESFFQDTAVDGE